MTTPGTVRPRLNPVVRWLLVAWAGCAVASLLTFVVALHSDAEIEQALEQRYAADVSFTSERRRRVLLIDGEDRNCKVAGHLFSLDDVAIRCFAPDEPPPLR